MRPEFRTKQARKWKEFRQVAEPRLPLLVENRFSQDLGTGLGESTSATTAVGTGTGWSGSHAYHESFAYGSLNEP
jgi:hypothetical protein